MNHKEKLNLLNEMFQMRHKLPQLKSFIPINEEISRQNSDKLQKILNYSFDPVEFYMGVNAELEHKDVTGGDLITTAKIAAAHLKENPKYYTLLKKYVEKDSADAQSDADSSASS